MKAQFRSMAYRPACPVCGSTINTTLSAVIDERAVSCPKGHSIQLVDQGDGSRKLDRSLDDLDRQLRKLGRRR
jgi:hypothetical protein